MDYVYDTFVSLGLTAERHCYKTSKHDPECNIIRKKLGAAENPKAVVIVAHLDSVGHNRAGADDNASGTGGLLELARIMSTVRTQHTLVFVAANGEEAGLKGSIAYVKALQTAGEISKFIYGINMDMIAYNNKGNTVDIETNEEFLPYVEWVSKQARIYTKLVPNITTPAWGSDHASFLDAGVPTYLSIEKWNAHNPCYHKACDTPDLIDWDYATEVVKLNAAVLAGKAEI
ncbi:M28 family peptidase [Bdellovibrionota bacterium FG-2]